MFAVLAFSYSEDGKQVNAVAIVEMKAVKQGVRI